MTSERRLERQLLQAQKLEAIGTLAGGIAHDFNNMLAVISVNAGLIDEAGLSVEAKESLGEIRDAAARSVALTRQLLTFSRRNVAQLKLVAIGEMLQGLSKLLLRIVGETIRVTTRVDPDLPEVNADTGMIEQAVMNLVINARDAMPRGGTVTVTAEPRDGGVLIAVSDEGTGIAPEVLPRIFDPFFTTKEVGKGTGLGLSTVFSIMERHGGKVEVDSQLGRGSTFRLWLPIAQGGARETPTFSRKASGGSEMVLVVEDDALVRRTLRTVLSRAGYHVVEAASADEALGLWATRRHEIALVVTDVVMPGCSGPELVERLRADCPKVKILFVSGYQSEPQAESIGRARLLPKPFEAARLLREVRELLDE